MATYGRLFLWKVTAVPVGQAETQKEIFGILSRFQLKTDILSLLPIFHWPKPISRVRNCCPPW
jgi:hypothetical protein